MSRSLNKIMLIGNLGQDPEIRTTSSGSRVANFSLATSRRWTGQDGQQQEKTEWHRIVAWDPRSRSGGGMTMVDVIERYLKKGEKAYVEGSVEYRQYEDKDGVTKYTTEVRAREIILLGSGGGGGGDREWSGGRAAGATGGGSRPAGAAGAGGRGGGAAGGSYDDFQAPPFEDDDLPF